MAIFLSLLRGINVSGQKKIQMTDLQLLYADLGFTDIRTYIQSGNVLFRHSAAKGLSEKIEQKILETYGFEVSVIIKTDKEMQHIVTNNPFLKNENILPDKLHVTFLSAIPQPERLSVLKTISYPPDEFIIKEKEIYIYCPNGYGRTKLTNNFFESKLKTKATTRNWKTVNELYSRML